MATKKMAAKLDGTRMETAQKKRRQIFFNNLILLEFNESYMERKHKIKFNKDMFAVPNKKGFEVVTHFLFSKLNEAIGDEEYRILFPVLDKMQAQEFRKTCHTHLNKISQEDSSISFPQIVPSIFLSPGGERFYELYLAFSAYVMQKFIEKDGMVKLNYLPSLTSENQKILSNILQLRTNASINRFVEAQKSALDNHQKLVDRAMKLTAVYRSYKQKLKETQILLQEKIKVMSTSSNIIVEDRKAVCGFEQDLLQESKERIEKVQKNWKLIENALMKEQDYWEIVRTEIAAESTEKYVLDGKEYFLDLPYFDRSASFSELEKRKLHLAYKDGKLCLTSFIDMWITCLDHYIRIFSEGKLPKVSSAEYLREALNTLTMNLNMCKSLSQRIMLDILPAMKQNVQELQTLAYSKLRDLAPDHDMNWTEGTLLCETSQMMEQLSFSENERNHPNLQPEQKVSILDDVFQTSAIQGQCSSEMQASKLFTEYGLSSTSLDDKNSFDSANENLLPHRKPSSPGQDLLDQIISPLKQGTMKTHAPSEGTGDTEMCDPYNLFGNYWAEEEIFATTLPSVPLLDGDSPVNSP